MIRAIKALGVFLLMFVHDHVGMVHPIEDGMQNRSPLVQSRERENLPPKKAKDHVILCDDVDTKGVRMHAIRDGP